MPYNVKRGLNRLFWVLAVLWALFWVVIYPMHYQWRGQREALIQYDKDKKVCDQLVIESPGWDLTKNCYGEAVTRERNALEFWSFKNFWMLPVMAWRLFLSLVVLPPIAVYCAAILTVWVWRGFKSQPKV